MRRVTAPYPADERTGGSTAPPLSLAARWGGTGQVADLGPDLPSVHYVDFGGPELRDGMHRDRFVATKRAAYSKRGTRTRLGAKITVDAAVAGLCGTRYGKFELEMFVLRVHWLHYNSSTALSPAPGATARSER